MTTASPRPAACWPRSTCCRSRARRPGAARAPEPPGQAQRAQRPADPAVAHRRSSTCPKTCARASSAARASTSAPGSTCRSWSSATSPAACCIRACGMRRSTRCSSAACRWSRCCTARWSAAGSSSPAPCHIRVAERSAYYGLPEGQRGIFVGGGGSARIPRLIGVARMTDMMMTGRVYDAQEGLAARPVAVRGAERRGPGQGHRAGRSASPATRRCPTSR